MNNAMQIIEWVIVGFTFLGSIYMYINHTRKLNQQQTRLNEQDHRLNEQQKLINEYQLKKNKEEEEESRMARLECSRIKPLDKKQANKILIFNKGKSCALNINMEILDNNGIGYLVKDEFFPYPKLLPQQNFEIPYLGYNKKPHYTIKITWDDDSAKERCIEQIIEL